MNRTPQAWEGVEGKEDGCGGSTDGCEINVSRPILSKRLEELGIDPDLIR